MSRKKRSDVVFEGGRYHVIVRGNNKMRVFHDRSDYATYLRLLREIAEIEGVEIPHYVLMPNHVHLLLVPSDRGLSKMMFLLQRKFAEHYRHKHSHVGHVWQGRFICLPVLTDAYVTACGDYIVNNPVRANMASRPEDWPYSSASTCPQSAS